VSRSHLFLRVAAVLLTRCTFISLAVSFSSSGKHAILLLLLIINLICRAIAVVATDETYTDLLAGIDFEDEEEVDSDGDLISLGVQVPTHNGAFQFHSIPFRQIHPNQNRENTINDSLTISFFVLDSDIASRSGSSRPTGLASSVKPPHGSFPFNSVKSIRIKIARILSTTR
jgi:hypothetical protein